MSSNADILVQHLFPLQALKQQFHFLFDSTALLHVPLTIDVKAAFFYVKQKLYFEKEKYSRLIQTPSPSVISPGQAAVVLAIVTEFLRILEHSSDLYAISMYRSVVHDVSGSYPL